MPRKPKAAKEFEGRWRITSMEQWDQEFVDAEVPGFIEIEPSGMGHFQFGYVRGNIDARASERDGKPAIEFSWEGMDEMDDCSGRGWAVLEGTELHGKIFFHGGDDSGFVARKKKPTVKKRPRRK